MNHVIITFVFLGAPAAVPLAVLLLLGGFLRNTAGESCEVFPAAALKELRVKGSLLSTGGGLEPFLLTGAGLASLARVSGAARASDFALLKLISRLSLKFKSVKPPFQL